MDDNSADQSNFINKNFDASADLTLNINNANTVNDKSDEKELINKEAEAESHIIPFYKALILVGKMTLGVAVLSIPQTLLSLSFIWGIIIIILFGFINYCSFNLIAYVSVKRQIFDYSKLVNLILGKKVENFVNICIAFSCFITIIAYNNIAYEIISHAIYIISYKETFSTFEEFFENGPASLKSYRAIVIYGLMLLVYFPLCLKRDLKGLANIAIVGTLSLIYIIIILIIECPMFYNDYLNKKEKESLEEPNWSDMSQSFDSKILFFVSCANIIFTFDCQYGLTAVYESLEVKTYKNFFKLNTLGILIITFLTVVIAVAGFLTSPTKEYEIIIFRNDLNGVDWFLSVGKFILCISIIVDIAINYNYCRLFVFEVLNIATTFTNKQNIIFAGIVYPIMCTISVLLSKIAVYLSLGGGLMSTLYCFILPAIMYCKENEFKRYDWKNIIIYIVTALVSIIGIVGGFMSPINELSPKRGR